MRPILLILLFSLMFHSPSDLDGEESTAIIATSKGINGTLEGLHN